MAHGAAIAASVSAASTWVPTWPNTWCQARRQRPRCRARHHRSWRQARRTDLENSDWNRIFARARYPLSPPIFSRIDLVYDKCIIEIIVRHLAHHTIATMSSSGSTYIPWSKCKATVPEGIDVPICFYSSLCKFMQSECCGLFRYPQPGGGTHPPNPRGGVLGIALSD